MTTNRRITWAPAQAPDLPPLPGAYALLITLDRERSATVGALGAVRLPAGRYVYCGSARGPGGIRARVSRHLRRGKRIHWHIDRLTAHGRITHVIAAPGGSECVLVAGALSCDGVTVPITGFGSSDCRCCEAHLLRISGDPAAVIEALEGLAGAIPPPA